jgi:hypothetical protein
VSDVMLHGILNMPPGIWDNSDIHKAQRHDAYKQASKRILELEKKLQNANEDLMATQDNLKSFQCTFEGIEGVFCDADGSPAFEPFNAKEISKWLKTHNLEQQAKGLSQYSEHLISDAEKIPPGLQHKGRGSNIYNWQTHFSKQLRYRANKLSNAKEALKEQDNG